jgi:hypothetical protein
LALAFEAAGSPDTGNSDTVQGQGTARDNMQTVLNFCQAAEVDANEVMEAIHTISNLHSRGSVLEELSSPGFE